MSDKLENSGAGSEVEEPPGEEMETSANMDSGEPVERKKSKREDVSGKKHSEKPPLKQKIIIKRSPKTGEGDTPEFQAITPTLSASNSPSLAEMNEDDEDLGTSLAPLTPKQEPDLDDSGCSGRLVERMFSEESQNSDSSMPPLRMCAFCNCGEKSLLGQGDLTRYDATPGFNPFKRPLARKKSNGDLEDASKTSDERSSRHATWRRKRGPPRSESREKMPAKSPRKPYSQVDEYGIPIAGVDELSLVGHPEDTEAAHVFEKTGQCWAHHCCAAWSDGVIQSEDYSLNYVDRAVFAGLSNRCSYCHRYGATIRCREPRCEKRFHYPCASGGGCFQDIKSLSLLCPEHTDKAEKIAGQEAQCVVCDVAGNIGGQLFCTSCGQHYHGSCLDPAVEVNPVVRAGWQCPECKICQTCRQPGDDNKMLVCDTCDKGYHTFCLRPAMVTIPKNGWKCKNCRVCGDCGSRTPGNGPSSRWHLNFSVCDSCYQQRNKGLFCPVCCKAYRQFTQKRMLECVMCKKFVHGLCDPNFQESENVERRRGKVANYLCPVCKNRDPDDPITTEMTPFPDGMGEMMEDKNLQDIDGFECFKSMKTETDLDPLQTSQDSLMPATEDSISSVDYDDLGQMDMSNSSSLQQSELTGLGEPLIPRPVGPGIGKPPIGKKIGKKPGPGRPRGRPPVAGPGRKKPQSPRYTPAAMVPLPGPGKRAPKVKIKLGALPGTSSLVQARWSVNEDDDPKATTVICSVKDDYTMKQDMCMSCGSLGKDKEGQLIACTQCGQCYHPFCVDVKVSRVILEKGWRCLDCTVCEGCDQQTDESRLILCDECDVSYHIYCLDPPLEKVPKGTWKCKWCAQCHTCGVTTPGFACTWQNNFTQCGQCSSLARCPVCENHYREDDNIIQCQSCCRWLHTECDGIQSEDDAERASDYGYHCLFCRPVTGQHGPLPPEAPPSPEPLSPIPTPAIMVPTPTEILPTLPQKMEMPQPPPPLPPVMIRAPPRQHLVDGVCLSDRGRSIVVQEGQKYEYKKPRGRRGVRGAGMTRGGGLLPIARLMSTDSKASEEDFDDNKESMDGDEMKLFPGDTPPHQLEGDCLPSPEKEGMDPLTGVPSTRGRGARSTRMRIGMGVGGFMARSRARGGSLRGRGVSRGTTLGRGGLSLDPLKKSRRPIKKALLEDSFPAYLQEAFFGRPILDNMPGDGRFELDDESYHADKDGGLESSATEIKSAIQVKDEHVFKEERKEVKTSHTSPMLIDAALTPRSNSQTDELQLSDSRQHETGAESDRDNIDDFDMILPELDNIFPAGSNFFDGIPDDLHEGDAHVGETNSSTRMDSDWLEPNIDVDKKLNPDMMSELAQIDSKTIEDVFKGVLDPSPTTGGDGNFNLPPLPSPPLQSQAGDHFHHPHPHAPPHPHPQQLQQMHAGTGAPLPTPTHSQQQLHAPSTPTQGASPSQDLAQQHQKLHAPSPGDPVHSPMGLPGHSPHHKPSGAASSLSMSVQQHLGVSQQLPPPPPNSSHPLSNQAPPLSQFMADLSWQNNASSTSASGQPHLSAAAVTSSQHQVGQPGQQQQQQPMQQSPQQKGVPPVQSPQQNIALQHQISTGSEEAEPEHMSWNKKNILKWEKDEPLGHMATISPVLYANINHPELKTQYADWNERAKQIAKIWRKIPTDERAPYLDKARENRAANRRLNKANKAKSRACDNRASSRLTKVQQLNQEVKRRKAAESAAAMPPPATVPTPDGLPRIPSQEHLGGMSPSTNSQPHTPTSDLGTPVKPGTPLSPTPPALPGNQVKVHDFGDIFRQPNTVPTPHMESFQTGQSPAREPSVTPHSDIDNTNAMATAASSSACVSIATTSGMAHKAQVSAAMSMSQGHPPAGFSVGNGEGFVRLPRPSMEDPYGRPPMTPLSMGGGGGGGGGSEDPYSVQPHTPRTPLESFSRPPSLSDPYAHPPHTPRTPQEHYEPRFPTPAPRMAVPFSRGQPITRQPPPEGYPRPPLNTRGPAPPQPQPPPPHSASQASIAAVRDQFQQQRSLSADPYAFQPRTPHPAAQMNPAATSDPYAQQPPTPQQVAPPTSSHAVTTETSAQHRGGGGGGSGQNMSFAELHPEMQQMLNPQRMAGPPGPPHQQPQPPYRASFYGNRPSWPQYPYYRGGEEKDNQQLRDLLAKQRQQTPNKKQEQQEMPGSQMPLHHWPSEETPRPHFQPPGGFPQYSQGGPVPNPQNYVGQDGPRPPPNYPGPARGGPWPPQMFPRGIPHGMRPPPPGGFPPQGMPQQGGFPPRGFQGAQRMPGQMPDMRPQMMQERLRSPQKDGIVMSGAPSGDPRQQHMLRHMRPGMMAMPRGMPPPGQMNLSRPQMMPTSQQNVSISGPPSMPPNIPPQPPQSSTSLGTQPYTQSIITQPHSHPSSSSIHPNQASVMLATKPPPISSSMQPMTVPSSHLIGASSANSSFHPHSQVSMASSGDSLKPPYSSVSLVVSSATSQPGVVTQPPPPTVATHPPHTQSAAEMIQKEALVSKNQPPHMALPQMTAVPSCSGVSVVSITPLVGQPSTIATTTTTMATVMATTQSDASGQKQVTLASHLATTGATQASQAKTVKSLPQISTGSTVVSSSNPEVTVPSQPVPIVTDQQQVVKKQPVTVSQVPLVTTVSAVITTAAQIISTTPAVTSEGAKEQTLTPPTVQSVKEASEIVTKVTETGTMDVKTTPTVAAEQSSKSPISSSTIDEAPAVKNSSPPETEKKPEQPLKQVAASEKTTENKVVESSPVLTEKEITGSTETKQNMTVNVAPQTTADTGTNATKEVPLATRPENLQLSPSSGTVTVATPGAQAETKTSAKSPVKSGGGAFQAQFLEFSRRQSQEGGSTSTAMDTDAKKTGDDDQKSKVQVTSEVTPDKPAETKEASKDSKEAVPMETDEKSTSDSKEPAAEMIPTPMQTDGCYDVSSSDSECDFEVEQIFNLTMRRIHRDQTEGLKAGSSSLTSYHSDQSETGSSPWTPLPQLDGAGDEDKPNQQNTGMSPGDPMSAVQGVILVNRSNPSSPAVAGKTPPGTPRTPKTPPATGGPKSPQRGGMVGGPAGAMQQQMHMQGMPGGMMGQSMPPGMMAGVQPQMGGMIRLPQQGKPRPATPHGHMTQTGPTMGNPPPPYPVQQPSGKSPKASQSPRPSPKPSPLQAPLSSPQGPLPSPHSVAVASPHGMQSPVTGSRSGTPQMSPRGSGSQPGTPQGGPTYPGFPQVNQGPPNSGMVGHMGPRMPATTQAAMAQLAHMAQGSRPQLQQSQPQQQVPVPQPQMMPPGMRPGHFPPHSMAQGHHPGMASGHPMAPGGGQHGMMPDQPQPPSAIAAMLAQHPRPPPQMMFRGGQPGMHPSMAGGGAPGQRQQFLPPGAQPPALNMRQSHPGGVQMMGSGAPATSQHLPMQGMRPQYPPGYPHRPQRPPPPPGHPGHPGMHPPTRGYPPGEVQIHTMPNVALSQAAAVQQQQQQHQHQLPHHPPPNSQQSIPNSMPVNPAQAALSSLAQAHSGPPGSQATVATSVHGAGVHGNRANAHQQPQVTSIANTAATSGPSTASNQHNVSMATASATTAASSSVPSSSASNSVLPSSIAAILSQATKEQAELNAAAAAAKNQGGQPTSTASQNATGSASVTTAAAISNATNPPHVSHQQPPHGKRFPGQQMGQRMQHMPPVAQGSIRHPGNMAAMQGQARKLTPQNITLLNEQPLLLEDLLEQEKIEQQRKQVEEHIKGSVSTTATPMQGGVGAKAGPGGPQMGPGNPGLLSDVDFEKLKVDVMADVAAQRNVQARPPHMQENWMSHLPPGQAGMFPRQPAPQMSPRTPSPYPGVQPPATGFPGPSPSPIIQSPPPKPTQPPMKEPQTEEERQQHIQYDQWLNANTIYLGNQMKDIETKVSKHRKLKKSLSAKQRNAKKNGNELPQNEQASLANAIEELQPLTKQLESIRKQHKSHNNLVQDYRNKMQEYLGPPPQPQQQQQSAPPQSQGQGPPPPPGGNWVGGHGPPPPTGAPNTMRPPAPPGGGQGQQQPQPRMPGANQPMRLPPQVRQEYENQMLQRIMMAMPPNPLPPPGHPAPPTMPQASSQQTQGGGGGGGGAVAASHSSPQPGHPGGIPPNPTQQPGVSQESLQQQLHPRHPAMVTRPPLTTGGSGGGKPQPPPQHLAGIPRPQAPPPGHPQLTKEQHEQLIQQQQHRQAAAAAVARVQASSSAATGATTASSHPPQQPPTSQQQPPGHHQGQPAAPTPPATTAQQQPAAAKQPPASHGLPQATKAGTPTMGAAAQEPAPKMTILSGSGVSHIAALEQSLPYYYGPHFQDENNPFSDTYLSRENVVKVEEPPRQLLLRPPAPREGGPRPQYIEGEAIPYPRPPGQPSEGQRHPHFPGQHMQLGQRLPGDGNQQQPPGFPQFAPRQRLPFSASGHQMPPGSGHVAKEGGDLMKTTPSPVNQPPITSKAPPPLSQAPPTTPNQPLVASTATATGVRTTTTTTINNTMPPTTMGTTSSSHQSPASLSNLPHMGGTPPSGITSSTPSGTLPQPMASTPTHNIQLPSMSSQLPPGANPTQQLPVGSVSGGTSHQEHPLSQQQQHPPASLTTATPTTPVLGSHLPPGQQSQMHPHHHPHHPHMPPHSSSGFTPPLPPFPLSHSSSGTGSMPGLPTPPMYNTPHGQQPPPPHSEGGTPQLPADKPKKKRKPKKKKDQLAATAATQGAGVTAGGGAGTAQGANQNQGHMQLPLDLDLRPMRMPVLPQFPPDFSLGSSPHAGSPGQLPQHPPQMLPPPHSHGQQPQQPQQMMVGMDRMGEHHMPGSISPIQRHLKGPHGNLLPPQMPPHSSAIGNLMPPNSGGMVPQPQQPPSSLTGAGMRGMLHTPGGGHMTQHGSLANMPPEMQTAPPNSSGMHGISVPPVTQPIPPQVGVTEAAAATEFAKHNKNAPLSPNSQTMLLKQLLASQKAAAAAAAHGRPPSRSLSETTDDADEMSLTPEQQRQLALIDRMPLFKEKEMAGEWAQARAMDEHSQMSMDSMASEPKKPTISEYDFSKQPLDGADLPSVIPNSPPQITATGKIKKRRKKKDGDPNAADKPAKKRPRKAMQVSPVVPIKEDSGPDYSAILDKVMSQVRLLPPLKLTEPRVHVNFMGMKDEQDLFGIYGYSSLEKEGDKYNLKPFPKKPPPTVFDGCRRRFFHEYSSHVMATPWLDQDSRVSQFTEKAHPPLPEKPQAPTPPILEGRNVVSRASDKSPATIIDTSSPETGFEEKPSYPGLRLISHVEGKSEEERQRECASPEIPVMCPVPRKVGLVPVKEEVKEELALASTSLPDIKQEVPPVEPENEPDDPMEDINNKVKDMSSAMGRLVKDPNEVSVTLTLNPNSTENIGGVIAAIADLLKIAVPPNYEVSRSPSPPPQPSSSAELFKTVAGPHKHKEELIHLQNLLKSQPKFCRHCDIIVLNAGVRKKKADVPYLKQDRYDFLDYGDETIVFCSQECYMEFDKAHRNVVLVQPRTQPLELDTKLSEPILSFLSPPHSSPSTSATLSASCRLDNSMSSTHSVPSTPDHHDNQLQGQMPLMPGSSGATPPSAGAKATDRPSLRKRAPAPIVAERPLVKKWKGQRYRKWAYSMVKVDQVYKVTNENDIHSLMLSLNITMKPKRAIKDGRVCCLCQGAGDLEADGPGRLLNLDVDRYVHLNCALWSYEVYETVSGALMNVEAACKRGANSECGSCHQKGATLGCFKQRCTNQYHLVCARKEGVVFFSDKTLLCTLHSPKHPLVEGELRNLSVHRKVYINREENRQVASIIHLEDKKFLLRIGSIIIQMIGQLLPHQIATGRFNTGEYIYPVGFKSTRYYWSYRRRNKRCKYVCRINDQDGWPEFTITVIEEGYDKVTHRDFSATGVWLKVLNPYDRMRRDNDMLKMFPSYLCGEDLFGLTEPAVLRVIESLPGVELMANYHFKFGRSSLYKMPVTINPTGCARSEPKLRTHFKKLNEYSVTKRIPGADSSRPHTLHTGGHTRTLPQTVAVVTDFNIPYSKQFVHSKSQQYRRLKTEWRNNVYLRRSNVQGLGLFAARDLEKHTMVIEYIGELIRNEVAEMREKMYEQQHRGIYMFRIDDNTVVDATMTGGPARYINHSCNPNCVAEVVAFEKDSKIIIITKRRLLKGEELTYDYKFDFEDDQHKIPCLCGATNCRKWMN